MKFALQLVFVTILATAVLTSASHVGTKEEKIQDTGGLAELVTEVSKDVNFVSNLCCKSVRFSASSLETYLICFVCNVPRELKRVV